MNSMSLDVWIVGQSFRLARTKKAVASFQKEKAPVENGYPIKAGKNGIPKQKAWNKLQPAQAGFFIL